MSQKATFANAMTILHIIPSIVGVTVNFGGVKAPMLDLLNTTLATLASTKCPIEIVITCRHLSSSVIICDYM